ncbi:MAG TPA: hypothetical protein VGD67_06690 [Pseudonocardiaceae bacterium]
MAGLMSKLRRFLSTPQGRRIVDQGRRAAADPRNRAKARIFLDRFKKR